MVEPVSATAGFSAVSSLFGSKPSTATSSSGGNYITFGDFGSDNYKKYLILGGVAIVIALIFNKSKK